MFIVEKLVLLLLLLLLLHLLHVCAPIEVLRLNDALRMQFEIDVELAACDSCSVLSLLLLKRECQAHPSMQLVDDSFSVYNIEITARLPWLCCCFCNQSPIKMRSMSMSL